MTATWYDKLNTRFRIFLTCMIVLLFTIIPPVIHHFHNHSDFEIHHDCPVFQWESGFVSVFVWYILFVCIMAMIAKCDIANERCRFSSIAESWRRRAPPRLIFEHV